MTVAQLRVTAKNRNLPNRSKIKTKAALVAALSRQQRSNAAKRGWATRRRTGKAPRFQVDNARTQAIAARERFAAALGLPKSGGGTVRTSGWQSLRPQERATARIMWERETHRDDVVAALINSDRKIPAGYRAVWRIYLVDKISGDPFGWITPQGALTDDKPGGHSGMQLPDVIEDYARGQVSTRTNEKANLIVKGADVMYVGPKQKDGRQCRPKN